MFKALCAVVVASQLAACGFRPLYGGTSRIDVIQESSRIQVAPMRDRVGQQLKNELELLLHSRGKAANPRYRLTAELAESKSSLAVKKNAIATRVNLRLSSRFLLREVRTGEMVKGWSNTITTNYNILESEYATLAAEKNARERAVQELAQEARVALGTVLGVDERKQR